MKSRFHLPTLAGCVTIAFVADSHAADGSWTGNTDGSWAEEGNWSATPAPGAGDTATFGGPSANAVIDLGDGVTIGSIFFDTAAAAAYTIGAGGAGNQTLTLDTPGNVVTMGSTVVNNQLIHANLALSATGAYTFTNDSPNLLSIGGGIGASTAGTKILGITGSGNTAISGAINAGAGAMNLLKTGTGALTLSGGGTFGAGAVTGYGGTFSAVLRGGATTIGGGAYTSAGEFVIGGFQTAGETGVDTKLTLNGGSLAINSWLSVGRGNGTGGVSSDLELNNGVTVTAENLSAGYHGGNGANLPKGSITLNDSAGLIVTGGNFIIGESDGSDFTVTLNGSSVVNATAATVKVGANAGKGALVLNSGATFNAFFLDVASGSNNAQAANGTVTVNAGATLNVESDFRTGFAGNSSAQATVNLEGGAINVATSTKRWMIIGRWDTTNSTINVNEGELNLNANTDIRFAQNNNAGVNVFNLNGGSVTSYSDNKITADGAGVVDLMLAGAAGTNNTFNLNGGSLTIRQVISGTNNGTRTFNFNGGTLKATGDSAAFFNLGTGNARANVRDDGAIIDTNGFNVTVAQALQHSDIDGDAGTDGGLTKLGAGTLTLTGNNTYNGGTLVSAGTLLVNGSLGEGAVTVAGAAIIGGTGSIGGNLHFESGAFLDITGGVLGVVDTATVSFAGTFGFDSIIGFETLYGFDVYNAEVGTYALLEGNFTLDVEELQYTSDNPLDLENGKFAYFSSGSLNVVVIPEPSAVLLGGFGILTLLRRRR